MNANRGRWQETAERIYAAESPWYEIQLEISGISINNYLEKMTVI